jgi:hypothetical protein
MIEVSRQHLRDGHFIVLWKDNTFTYSYFLWFEDQSVCKLNILLIFCTFKNVFVVLILLIFLNSVIYWQFKN